MSEQDNIGIAKQAYANFKSGDIASLLGMLSDDVQWTLPEIENVPFAGKRRGRAAVADFFAGIAATQDVVAFEPLDFIAQNEKVVVQGRYTWRHRESGKDYSGEWAHVFTVRDGKVVAFQEYTDTAQAAAAFQKALRA